MLARRFGQGFAGNHVRRRPLPAGGASDDAGPLGHSRDLGNLPQFSRFLQVFVQAGAVKFQPVRPAQRTHFQEEAFERLLVT